jgi:hypothetical protein
MIRNYIPLVLIIAISFFSRLPFLNNTYGAEEDSYGFVLSVWQTYETGVYETSRLPGHPVHEFFFQLLPYAGCFWFNFFSTVMSLVAIAAFYFIYKELKLKQSFIATLAFSLTPVFFISSTYTIDFVWALAFILLSFLFLLKEKYFACAFLLALATGCRITSAAVLLPFLIFVFQANTPHKFKTYAKLVFTFFVFTLLFYIPVIKVYGIEFFTYYDQFPYPPITKLIYKMTVGVFGAIGCVTIFVFSVLLFIKHKQHVVTIIKQSKILFVFIAAILLLFFIAYVRLPQKSGYMLPIVPFLIMAFAKLLPENSFRFFCVGIMLSLFFFGVNITDSKRGTEYTSFAIKFTVSGQEIFIDPISGPILNDCLKRRQKDKFVDSVINEIENFEANCTVISGWWYNQILVRLHEIGKDEMKTKFVFYISENAMREKLKSGELLFLPEQALYNDLYSGIKTTNKLALPLFDEQ